MIIQSIVLSIMFVAVLCTAGTAVYYQSQRDNVGTIVMVVLSIVLGTFFFIMFLTLMTNIVHSS